MTGVQTCALPIYGKGVSHTGAIARFPSTIGLSPVDSYGIRRSPSHAVPVEHGVDHRLRLGQYPKVMRQVVTRCTALGAPWTSQMLGGALKPTSLRLTAEQFVATSRCKHGTYTHEKQIIALIGETLGGLLEISS